MLLLAEMKQHSDNNCGDNNNSSDTIIKILSDYVMLYLEFKTLAF